MQYGLVIFPTEQAMPMIELGPAVEQRGFESLWVAEHSHIPVSRRSPWPGGAELPRMYYEAMDPFVALTAAAGVTSRIKLATGICLIVQRDPIQTAKQVASLDRISNGRFLLGVGGGWNAEEMANHGTDFGHRFKLLRERIEAMKCIWTQEQAEYHGELVDFDPVFAWPKPAQQPHPPIHVGGQFPGGARRAVRYGNGWIPISEGRGDPLDHVAEFHRMARDAGRDPASLELTLFGPQADKDRLARIRDAGATRVVLGLPPAPREQVLPLLDHYAGLAQSLG